MSTKRRPAAKALLAAAAIAAAVAVVGGTPPRTSEAWRVHPVVRDSEHDRGLRGSSERAHARSSATWCGAPSQVDVTPNAVAGYAAHWIYALPSDGADGFATYGSAMQTDAESIDSWWRSHDATRVPRNDLVHLACGLQLDLTRIRLPGNAAELAGEDTRFFTIAVALVAMGFDSPHTKYVVYYDGPGHPDICGEGGSHDDGYGYAIVYVRACAGVPQSTTAAHELLHTLGAVPSGAPNDCSAPRDGHVCDDSYDLMFPFGDETPITGLSLDTGRDDYYGHAGSQLDVRDSPWLLQLDQQTPLQLAVSGPGSVTGDVPGLRCTQSCATAWNAGTDLVLTAEPSAGAKLVRWGAACRGRAACSVSLSRATSVSALFAPSNVALKIAVAGRGTVRSSLPGVACRGRCSSLVPSYEPLRLIAKPVNGWRFKGWSGSCRGRGTSCTLLMTEPATLRAVFGRAA